MFCLLPLNGCLHFPHSPTISLLCAPAYAAHTLLYIHSNTLASLLLLGAPGLLSEAVLVHSSLIGPHMCMGKCEYLHPWDTRPGTTASNQPEHFLLFSLTASASLVVMEKTHPQQLASFSSLPRDQGWAPASSHAHTHVYSSYEHTCADSPFPSEVGKPGHWPHQAPGTALFSSQRTEGLDGGWSCATPML